MFAVALQCLLVNEDVKSPNGIMPNHRTESRQITERP